jgi:uncharacterized membrane protein
MKTFLKSIAILSITVSIALSLYGSVKIARANKEPIEVEEYERLMDAAKKAFTCSGILFVSGLVFFVAGVRVK